MIKDMFYFSGETLTEINKQMDKCTPPQKGMLAYTIDGNKYYTWNGYNWVPLIDTNTATIPVVKFGNGLPQTNSAEALGTITNPIPDKTSAWVLDMNTGDAVLHLYTSSGWVAHTDHTGTNNHFDFTTYTTKQDANNDVSNKNPNDLVYVAGDQKFYYVDSNKQLVPIDLGLGNKQDNVGFALADIDGNGNDDVYNKLGHKLMLTDSSGNIIPVIHEGQAIPKKYLDGVTGDLTTLLTTNKGNIVQSLNELYNTGNQLNADIQSKLKHLTSAEHIVEYNTGNPSDPVTSANALATITNPTEGDKALLIDKTAGKSRLEIYHNNNWLMLTDDVGGNIDLTAYQTTAQADNKYATKTALGGKQDSLTTSQKAVVNGDWVPKHDVKTDWIATGSGSVGTAGQVDSGFKYTDSVSKITSKYGFDRSGWFAVNSTDGANDTLFEIAPNHFNFSLNGTKSQLLGGIDGIVISEELPSGDLVKLGTRYGSLVATQGATSFMAKHDNDIVTKAFSDMTYVPKKDANYNWGLSGYNDDTMVTQDVHKDASHTVTRIGQDGLALQFMVGGYQAPADPNNVPADYNPFTGVNTGLALDSTKLKIIHGHSLLSVGDDATYTELINLTSSAIKLSAGTILAETSPNNPFIATGDSEILTKKYADTKLFKTNNTGHIVFDSGTASTNTKDELLQALDSFLSSVPGADMNAKLLKIAGVVGAWT